MYYLNDNLCLLDDLVYMPDTQLLNEYVLQDVGKIWMGSWDNNRGRMWYFGQFDSSVLPAITLMFERSELKDSKYVKEITIHLPIPTGKEMQNNVSFFIMYKIPNIYFLLMPFH